MKIINDFYNEILYEILQKLDFLIHGDKNFILHLLGKIVSYFH